MATYSQQLREQQSLFVEDVITLLMFIYSFEGYTVSLGEAHRPDEMQKIYLEKGLTKTLESYHQKRLAIDLNIFVNGVLIDNKVPNFKKILQPIGDKWESLDPLNRWGGNFKSFLDTPHFERAWKPK